VLVRVGIIQSNYIPWRGYFDFIDSVDVFVLLDDVQYTRRDWRNRNKIKTKDGLHWLTIPVNVKDKYTQAIQDVKVVDGSWAPEHLKALRHAYAKAPHFASEFPWVEDTYALCRNRQSLSDINLAFLTAICGRLGVATPMRQSSEFDLHTGKSERLIGICRQLGADTYVSGPAARDYIDAVQWRDNGIEVLYKSYDYPEYPQSHPPFEHGVTVLDLIFNTGPDARSLMKSRQPFES
jgi:hypothetical protein